MSAKISVIIPIYNAEAFLARCLESVLKQTFHEIEIICVNDGSSDRSGEILAAYQGKDSRLTILKQKNEGTAVARNRGLAKATGEFIYYLDADDVMHPQLLEYALFLAQKHEAELVCFGWVAATSAQIPDVVSLKPFVKKRSKFQIDYNSWSKLYRRSLAERVSFSPGNTVEDLPHTACVLRDNPKTVISQACLYYYTVRPDSVSGILCTPQKIDHYHQSLLTIYHYYRGDSEFPVREVELAWLRRHLFPNVLKQQLNQILRIPLSERTEVLERFRSELKDLKQKGLLSWRDYTVSHFLKYYLRYQLIIAGRP
jgi:glycosyltransferase involved in cell wall biosynthesis